jgi:hypothetical protein
MIKTCKNVIKIPRETQNIVGIYVAKSITFVQCAACFQSLADETFVFAFVF